VVNFSLHAIQSFASSSGTHERTTVTAECDPLQDIILTCLSDIPSTSVGLTLFLLSPWPNTPLAPRPHVKILPFSAKAIVECDPHATCVIFPGMLTGLGREKSGY
jgi:hypothetical protein